MLCSHIKTSLTGRPPQDPPDITKIYCYKAPATMRGVSKRRRRSLMSETHGNYERRRRSLMSENSAKGGLNYERRRRSLMSEHSANG